MFLRNFSIHSCIIILCIIEKKNVCRYCLQDFSTAKISKLHIKDCFKINGKQRIIIPKIGEYVKFKNYERKIKLPFIVYAVLKVF